MSSGSEMINSDELINKIALIWFSTVSGNTLFPHSIFVLDNGQARPSTKCVWIYIYIYIYIYISNIKNYVTWTQVQIHGPVSLSENVECIVVNARHQADTRIGSLLDLFVERNKCNLIWMDPDDLTGLVPTPHGAFGHHLSAGSLSGSLGRRRSLGRTTTRKRRKRWRLGLNLGRKKLD